jgi:hypothetical protein
MTLFFEIACRVAIGARILVNVLVTLNTDDMRVGNATWKRSVNIHSQLAFLHTTTCSQPTLNTNETHYTCISTYAKLYSQFASAMRILMNGL